MANAPELFVTLQIEFVRFEVTKPKILTEGLRDFSHFLQVNAGIGADVAQSV
jgi:hypothetical protein